MTRTLRQRLERTVVRLDELKYWRERESVDVDGWTFDGAPLALGAAWILWAGAIGFIPPLWALARGR